MALACRLLDEASARMKRRQTAPELRRGASMFDIAFNGLGAVLIAALVWQASGLWVEIAGRIGRWLDGPAAPGHL